MRDDKRLIGLIWAGRELEGMEGLQDKYGISLTQFVLRLGNKFGLSREEKDYVIRETWFTIELHIEDAYVENILSRLKWIAYAYIRDIAPKEANNERPTLH